MSETAAIVLGFVLPCLMTTLGAVLVFFFKRTSKIVNMITIGLAAGIMLSASIWSLLVPALENAQAEWGDLTFLPVVIGFVLGGLMMLLMDFVSNRLYREKEEKDKIGPAVCHSECSESGMKNLDKPGIHKKEESLDSGDPSVRFATVRMTGRECGMTGRECRMTGRECRITGRECRMTGRGLREDQKRTDRGEADRKRADRDGVTDAKTVTRDRKKAFKMFTAITIHNIPEGLSVGFAIGTATALHTPILAALMFALGIALQNFPEGLATALPLYTSLGKKGKAFFLATLSGLVEPLFALVGFFLAAYITSLLPWLLAFAAGAMIYVIVEEMIPEIQIDDQKKWGTWSFVIGFVVMMILDICL